MKKLLLTIIGMLLCIGVYAATAGNGESQSIEPKTSELQPPTDVKLLNPEIQTIYYSGTYEELNLQFTPDGDDIDKKLEWTCTPKDALRFEYLRSTGKTVVLPRKLGVSEFTGRTTNGLEVNGKITVNGIYFTNITGELVSLNPGETFVPIVECYPSDIGAKTTNYFSKDESIAICKDGVVTAIKPGRTFINCPFGDYAKPNITHYTTFDVEVCPPVGELVLSESNLSLKKGVNPTHALYVIYPKGEKPEITEDNWKSSNTDVAKIGYVNGSARLCFIDVVGVGKTTITFTDGNMTASCDVTVFDPNAESFTLEHDVFGLEPGGSVQIEPITSPEGSEGYFVYTIFDTSIATVDQNGLITAGPTSGTTTGTVIMYLPGGGSREVKFKVYVGKLPEAMEFKEPNIDLDLGSSTCLEYEMKFTPDGEDVAKVVYWTVEPEGQDIVELDTSYDDWMFGTNTTLRSKKYGTVNVTGVTPNGLTVKGTVTVNGIEIAGPTELSVGEEVTFTATASSQEIMDNLEWTVYSDKDESAYNTFKGPTLTLKGTKYDKLSITAKAVANGKEYSKSYYVTVYPAAGGLGLEYYLSSANSLRGNSESMYVEPVFPLGEDAEMLTWSSSDASVANVTSGNLNVYYISGFKAGKATITFTRSNGESASMDVTVHDTMPEPLVYTNNQYWNYYQSGYSVQEGSEIHITAKYPYSENSIFWYTLDGTDPVTSSTRIKYEQPIIVESTLTIKTYAEPNENYAAKGLKPSDVVTYILYMGDQTRMSLPVASVASGSTVKEGTSVELTSPEGGIILYTTDGTYPYMSATVAKYEAPIALTEDVIIQTYAVPTDELIYDGWDSSLVQRFNYTVSPTSGVYGVKNGSLKVTPTASLDGFTVYGAEDATVRVFTSEGALVKETANVSGSVTMDMKDYVSGFYIVNVCDNNNSAILKFLKR